MSRDMSETEGRVIGWGARVAYLGPPFELSAHRNSVSVFCASLYAPMRVTDDPSLPASAWRTCRTAFVPANTVHVMRFGASPILCLYLDLLGDDACRVAASMKSRAGRLLIDHAAETDLLLSLRESAVQQADALRSAIAESLSLPDGGRRDPRIEATIALMRKAPGEAHSLRTLALAVGLSEDRLRHTFKAATGVPFRRFRIWNRVGAAMKAAQRGATLTEAAHEAGFSSSAHFSACFREMFGLSPSTFIGVQRRDLA